MGTASITDRLCLGCLKPMGRCINPKFCTACDLRCHAMLPAPYGVGVRQCKRIVRDLGGYCWQHKQQGAMYMENMRLKEAMKKLKKLHAEMTNCDAFGDSDSVRGSMAPHALIDQMHAVISETPV